MHQKRNETSRAAAATRTTTAQLTLLDSRTVATSKITNTNKGGSGSRLEWKSMLEHRLKKMSKRGWKPTEDLYELEFETVTKAEEKMKLQAHDMQIKEYKQKMNSDVNKLLL